jgi:RNA polymerase sigma-70 factor (ECF subfamily)
MECPAGTVMSRLYRGRKILQRLLHDYAVEQGILKQGATPAPDKKSDDPVDLASYRRKKISEA